VQEKPDEVSLEVSRDGVRVFVSAGRWLYPLLDLEEFLAKRSVDPSRLSLRDKIVGRAAALLIVRLGIQEVHAGILSRLGEEIFRTRGIRFSCDELVERIACQTEELLRDVTDADEAHALIVSRARARAAATRADGVPS
jgi:zinc transport system ATP-binding protein